MACVSTSPPPWLSPTASPDHTAAAPASPDHNDFLDFEFRLGDSHTMLPADQLFSGGLLLAPHAPPKNTDILTSLPDSTTESLADLGSVTDSPAMEVLVLDPRRAPRCSSRWREMLGLRRPKAAVPDPAPAVDVKSPRSAKTKHLLNWSSKSNDSDLISISRRSLSSKLANNYTRDSDSDLVSISSSSRRSLSSSSSSSTADHDEFQRLSLDSPAPPRIRLARPAAPAVLAESPRMNACGRVVFDGLERSSSSPGSFTGGPRPRTQGMERRCYSSNVRVTPVLNVPVRSVSIFGFGQLFSPRDTGRLANVSRVKVERDQSPNVSKH